MDRQILQDGSRVSTDGKEPIRIVASRKTRAGSTYTLSGMKPISSCVPKHSITSHVIINCPSSDILAGKSLRYLIDISINAQII